MTKDAWLTKEGWIEHKKKEYPEVPEAIIRRFADKIEVKIKESAETETWIDWLDFQIGIAEKIDSFLEKFL